MPTRVLIIESDEPRLRLLEWGLREEGLEVEKVVGRLPTEVALRPDVIVMNTGMATPGKTAWIESLRYIVPGVFIVDLVGDDADGERHHTGADAYLHKPFRIDDLQKIIAQLRARGDRAESGPAGIGSQ